MSWSGDIVGGWNYLGAGSTPQDLGYWYTEDRKGLVGSDTIVIPANAERPVLAHRFLNYMLDFDTAMTNFAWLGYQPPPERSSIPTTLTTTKSVFGQPFVFPWMDAAVVRKEDFDLGYQQWELTPTVDNMWHTAWQNFRAGAQ